MQCLSLWPGFSRSGATISGGVLFGMSHKTAADFTFIMAVPIMAGASCICFEKLGTINMDDLSFYQLDLLVHSYLHLSRLNSS